MIYLKNNIAGKTYPVKKVGEIEYRETLPKSGVWTLSRIIRGLDAKQVALVGVPFTDSYDVDARVKVTVDDFHLFTLINPYDRIWKLDSSVLLHAYEDDRPLGAFAHNQVKITIEWIPRKEIGREVPCGIKMGVYEEIAEDLK